VRGSYYDVLGVAQSSTDEDIRQRYLQLMRRYHPDYNRTSLAQVRSAEINEAYRHLSDKALRAGHNAQLTAKRQDVVAARVPSFPSYSGGTALVKRRRPSPIKRYAATLAFTALICGTGVVGWQIQQHMPQNRTIPFAIASDPGDGQERREVAALVAASTAAERAMPPLSRTAVQQGVQAFRRLARSNSGDVRSFSKLCHARAACDDGWNALDFCAAFDEAAYRKAVNPSWRANDAAYFVERHDRAAQSYIYKVSSTEAIDGRLLRIKALVSAMQKPQRGPVDRVLHGISKRSWQMADTAWKAIGPASSASSGSQSAHDF
jgi:hypothetical protein